MDRLMWRKLGLAVLSCLMASATLVACANAQTIVFDDEFDSGVFDTTQWAPMERGGDTSNSEVQCYLSSNAVIQDGTLELRSQPDQTGCAGIGTPYAYSSSMVQWRTFNFLYGTLETRIRFAGGAGTWPALWLLGANCQQSNIITADSIGSCSWPNPGSDEIDVAEVLHGQHYAVNEQVHSSLGNPGCSPNVDDVTQWHVYTMTWGPGQLTFSIDGVQTCSIADSAVPSTPMFLMINTAMGGQGGAVDSSSLPQTTQIDYVRVYQ